MIVEATFEGKADEPNDTYARLMGYQRGRRYRLELRNAGAERGRALGPHDVVIPLAIETGEWPPTWSHDTKAKRVPYTLRGFLMNWANIVVLEPE